MISTMDQAFSWPHSTGFPLSIQTQSLTSGALYSPAAPPLKTGLSTSSLSSLASFSSGSYGYGNGSPVLGGMGIARESQAQWSAVGSDSNSTKSPLERLGFKLHLTGEKKTRDGQLPKRRGPKPDSKPALTRRQELNRQAQRTHRERKENYIKALEQEVLALKEKFGQTSKERDTFADENRRMKELLAAHGIQYDFTSLPHPYQTPSSQFGGSAGNLSGSQSHGSMSTGMTSPPSRAAPGLPHQSSMGSTPPYDQQGQQYQQQPQQGVNYDQVGIDFVLTLERPCTDHMQFLMVRSEDSDGEISGHALMATCPPASHIRENPEEKHPVKMPDMPDDALAQLLDLSSKIQSYIQEAEVPPIKAWAIIKNDPRCAELTQADFVTIRDELVDKIRCYGFGAVVEEFEVHDALENVLARKATSSMRQMSLVSSEFSPYASEDFKMDTAAE